VPTLDNSVMTLEDGRVIQATQIGQPIPLTGTPGQPIVMAMPASVAGGGEQQQFQIVHVPALSPQNGQ
jgi:hypothetical protein